MDKFREVPLDSETKIVQSHYSKIGDFDVKLEYWLWSVYKGCSAIFGQKGTALDDILNESAFFGTGTQIGTTSTDDPPTTFSSSTFTHQYIH